MYIPFHDNNFVQICILKILHINTVGSHLWNYSHLKFTFLGILLRSLVVIKLPSS